MADELRVATAFRFRVTLSNADGPLAGGGFQECLGLDLELDSAEYLEGGRNNGVIQRVGRLKVARLTLRRGMLHPHTGTARTELWRWFQDVVDGVRPVRRYDGTVDLLGTPRSAGQEHAVLARWTFSGGLPARIAGPQLNALTGAVAIEELQVAHSGLRWELI